MYASPVTRTTSQLSQPSSSISAWLVGKNGAIPNRWAQYGRYENSPRAADIGDNGYHSPEVSSTGVAITGPAPGLPSPAPGPPSPPAVQRGPPPLRAAPPGRAPAQPAGRRSRASRTAPRRRAAASRSGTASPRPTPGGGSAAGSRA